MVNSSRAITKIVLPNRNRRLLHRPRLVNFLHDHLEHKLIVISASAGYGKTSLLLDFAHETSLPVCWYSLDDSDRDPHVFLDYLTATVNRQFPTIGEQAQRALASGDTAPGFDAVVGALINEIQDNLTAPFVIVLDDYHAVAESEAVNRIVESLLFLLPQTVHLIVASRTLPTQLPLTRLQARQQVAGLGCGDLQFTAEEIRALVVQNHQIQLSAQQAADLAKQSEGWIAGILLTTPYLWKGLFHWLVEVTGAQEKLFHYLASEAFTRLPPELQQFLLDSSVLSRLEATICDELLGTQTAAALLRTLEEQNLFIVRLNGESADPSYRYHHLFQEFLRHHLKETDATHWRDLNRRAAALFEARDGFTEEPIVHYLAAEMYEEAARTIERIAQAAYDEGRWAALAGWIDALAPEVLKAHPSLLVTRGMLFAETGNSAETERAYNRALEIYEGLHDELGAARVIVWRALFWRLQGRYREAIQACEGILETLRRYGAQTDEARAYRILGSAHALLGDIPRGAKELEQALKLYEHLHDEVRVAWLHHDIGTYLRLQGDPSAERHYAAALDYWRRTRNLVGEAMTLNSIGVGQHQAGNLERARATLEQACELAHRSGNRRNEAFALTSLGDVYRDQAEAARALEAYQAARSIGEQVDGFVLVYALVALGEAHHRSGNVQEAERCLAQALENAQAHQSSYEIGLVETAIGIWKCQGRQSESAIAHLSHAVDLLKPACRDRTRARLHLARAYFLHRQYDRAKQHLRALASEGGAPKNGSIPFLLADRLMSLTFRLCKGLWHVSPLSRLDNS
jgi:ATP/maltotriose-dependent transcriptional regulator MalT